MLTLALVGSLSLFTLAPQAGAGNAAQDFEGGRKLATLSHPPLAEVSGIARSSYPGIYWVHNDSGDSARLFAIDETGAPIVPAFLAPKYEHEVWPGFPITNAWNQDWEDIAVADGTIYVADMGNNGNARRDLGVYVINEPNPRAFERTRALTFLPVRYPDQARVPADEWRFDCEALFVADGALHFLTKHREPGRITGWGVGTKLYRLDTRATDTENVLTLVGQRDDVSLVTAADLSPAGDRLALATYTALWIFARPADGDAGNWLAGTASRLDLPLTQTRTIEALTWRDASSLLIANEGRDLFEIDTAAFERVD